MLSSHCPQANPEDIEFEPLNVSLLGIRVLDKVHPSYYFVSELYLDSNNLFTLNGIEQFVNLEIFSFCWNCIDNFNELNKIKNAFFLRKICFEGNPIETHEKARFDYLKTHLFKNLEGVFIEETGSAKRFKSISNKVANKLKFVEE